MTRYGCQLHRVPLYGDHINQLEVVVLVAVCYNMVAEAQLMPASLALVISTALHGWMEDGSMTGT